MRIYTLKNSGEKIRKLRIDNNMTQEALADRLGVTREYIGRVERGRNGISIDMAIGMSEIFEVKIEDVLAVEDKKEKNREKIAKEIMVAIMNVLDENKLFTKSGE